VGGERVRPLLGVGKSGERRHPPPRGPGDRRDARDPRVAVDPDRAAAALALRAAPVLGAAYAQAVAQDFEEGRRAVRLNLDVAAVEGEPDQEKLWPQPQVRVALGLVMAKPDCSRPSL
jgi:hypothetical protein